MQILSLVAATGPTLDSGTAAGAWLEKQLFLWALHSEFGDCLAPVRRMPPLPHHLEACSYLE
jgi:hypothetical protein